MSEHNPPWFDPAMPSRNSCVIRHMLDEAAQKFPDRRLVRFEDGTTWTYGEARTIARATAAALQQLGVRRGEPVSVWLPNGKLCLRALLGINYLGAIFAPFNIAYRGRLLEHVIVTTGAALAIVHGDLLPRMQGLSTGALTRIIATDAATDGPAGVERLPVSALDGDPAMLDDREPLEPWDLHAVIYTSGTTGPSKGVLQTYLQIWTTGQCSYGYLRAEDCMIVNLPLFHVGGTSSIYAVLSAGASFALYQSFNARNFWQEIRDNNATTTCGLIGSMAEFLMKAEPRADDADNPLRILTMAPVNRQTMAFARRFGFDWLTGFNMTEVSVPLITPVNSTVEYGCGVARSGIEARVVDEYDLEVPPGTVGELILRSDHPWTLFQGYLNMPEATARAWRNGWFHTGDAFRRDAGGNFFFVDRIKDTIRRRGENISSVEVEAELMAHPAIAEAAAVAVASPLGEDEIMACIALKPDTTLAPADLIAFLQPRMAHFMAPRYVRILAALPRTPTNKVQKAELRAAGVTPDAWDREAAGIVLRREKLTT